MVVEAEMGKREKMMMKALVSKGSVWKGWKKNY
jgi:hypothetical protein